MKRRLASAVTLGLMLAGLSLILRPAGNEYAEYLRQGHAHAGQMERTAAALSYRNAARLRPGCPLPHLSLARLYLDWGRTDAALEAVAQAERARAEPIEVGRLRVAIHLYRAELDSPAQPAHWKAVQVQAESLLLLEPEDRAARHAVARSHLALREWDAARAIYEELWRSDIGDRKAQEQLGVLLLGEDPEALEHLHTSETELAHQILEALAPGEHIPGASGAELMEETEDMARALAHTSARVGQVLIERREWALAVRQLEFAVLRRPDYANAQAYLGHALDQIGYPLEARSHLQAAVEAAPESPVAITLLGMHYDRSGATTRARAQYERAYDLATENPAICVMIGQSWAAEDRYVAAEIWLREAVSLSPDDPGLWEILAGFYVDHSITADNRAVKATEHLLSLDPANARAHYLRGLAASQVGDYGVSDKHLRRAIWLDPHLAQAHYQLGLVRSASGRREQAEEAFDRAIDLDTTGILVSLVNSAKSRRVPQGGQ